MTPQELLEKLRLFCENNPDQANKPMRLVDATRNTSLFEVKLDESFKLTLIKSKYNIHLG